MLRELNADLVNAIDRVTDAIKNQQFQFEKRLTMSIIRKYFRNYVTTQCY